MNVESELLWPGVALLLLLGTVAGLCVRCSRPAVKKSEKIYEQRSSEEDQQNFAVAQTYSLVRQAWPGPLGDTDSNVAATRKDKLLRFSPSLEDSESSRYQNFSKGSRHRSRSGSDAAYIDPITTDYYNWGQFQKPREDDDDDDANSYENVLICKQKDPASDDEGSEDYQNSASIRQWRESRRVVEQVPREVPLSLAGSPDEDSEDPDYPQKPRKDLEGRVTSLSGAAQPLDPPRFTREIHRGVPRTVHQAVGDRPLARLLREPEAEGGVAPAVIRCPSVEASCIPVPTSENSVSLVCPCPLALDSDSKLLTNVNGWDLFRIHKPVQLIYAGRTVFNTLHLRVEILISLVSGKHYTSFQQLGEPGAPFLGPQFPWKGRGYRAPWCPSVGMSAVDKAHHVSGEGVARSG